MKKRGVSRRPREGEEDVVEKDEEEGAAAAMDSRENLEYIASVVSHHQEQLRLLGREAAAQAQGEEPGMDYLEFAKRRRFVRRPFFGQGYRDRLGWVLVGLVMLIIGHNYISYTLWNWVRLDSYPIFTVLRYCVHNLFILLSLWSYYRCIFTNPGTIPKTVRQVWHSTVTQFLSRRKEQLELREQHKERQEQVQEQGQQQQQALQGHDGLHDAGQEVQEKEKQGGGGGGGGGGGSRRRRKADEGGAPAESQEHAMEEGQSQSKQANGHHASGVAGADATGVTVGCVGGFLTPEDMLQDAKERDFDGKYRYCRSCELPKPDRTHHCSSCKRCIMRVRLVHLSSCPSLSLCVFRAFVLLLLLMFLFLMYPSLQMDHHCPWVHNCVGLYNYKFFLLFLFHTSIASFISFLGFIPEIINALGLFRNLATIRKAWLFHLVAYSQAAAPPSGVLSSINLFISVFMAVFFWLALGGFFLYHLYLVLHNRTTIESLEKNWREKQRQAQGLRPNIYDRGHKANFLEVFGPRPVDWFLPILS